MGRERRERPGIVGRMVGGTGLDEAEGEGHAGEGGAKDDMFLGVCIAADWPKQNMPYTPLGSFTAWYNNCVSSPPKRCPVGQEPRLHDGQILRARVNFIRTCQYLVETQIMLSEGVSAHVPHDALKVEKYPNTLKLP